MQISWIANVLGQAWQQEDREVAGFSIDTRTLEKGEVFIAIRGADVDGHEFVRHAYEKGALAAIVDHPVECELPQLCVQETQAALFDLAAQWRPQFSIPTVAITGSCGKTSTRALMQGIFSVCGHTLASERSYNNCIGVPLTVLRLNQSHQYAVFEIGANHLGEITPLTKLVKPSVAVITLAALSHLAGFGDLQGIAKAKGEIYQGLSKDGIGVVNADDQFCAYWRELIAPKRSLSFGLSDAANVTAKNLSFDENACPSFTLVTPVGQTEITLKLMGEHSVANALAASAAAVALSIPLAQIKQGLESVLAPPQRLVQVRGFARAKIIDDSYNANPASVKAAINVLANLSSGTSILVLGDMGELGDKAGQLHQEMGACAHAAGISYLFTLGQHSAEAAQAFGPNAQHFSDKAALIKSVRKLLNNEVTVLVKGSNFMGMNQVVQSLLEE